MTNLFKSTFKFLGIFCLAVLLGACGGGESADDGSTTTATAADETDYSGDLTVNETDIISEPGSATLSWTPPTQNLDGTTLTDLSGYKIYYGTQQGNYPNSITINNPGVTEYVIDNLPGNNTYYFAIAALDSENNESGLSNVASKTI